MKLITLIFCLIGFASYSQKDTTIYFNEAITFEYFPDSLKIDTFKTERNTLLPITISNGFVRILGFDTLKVIESFRRLDSAIVFVMQNRVITSVDSVWIELDSLSDMIVKLDTSYEIISPIIGILRDGYFDVEYPKKERRNNGEQYTRTVMFILPPKPPYSD